MSWPFPPSGLLRWLIWLLIPILLWSAWRWGRHSILTEAPRLLRVNGASMVPTLMGPFAEAHCDTCQLSWQVDPAAWRRPAAEPKCSHCGGPLRLIDPSPETSAAGDVVSIRPLGPGEPTRGDLVAVRWQGGLHVKRVVGLPGDTISLDALRLRIDDQRIEDLLAASGRELPSLLVDSDAHRPRSRWAPRGDDGGWTRTPQRIWQSIAENPAWLVYEHRSVYRHPQPGPVLDDYPFNVTLARKLFGVERLLVRARVDAEPQTEVEVAFWSAAGIRRARVRPADRSELAVGWYDAEPCDAENSEGQPPVTANDPLAIRIRGGPITLAKLTIERFVEYRLRPHDDRAAYPLRLGEGECFVLGDNVPVSVDSRNIGPVPLVSIAGVVVRVDRSPLKALKADPGVSKHGAVSGLPR